MDTTPPTPDTVPCVVSIDWLEHPIEFHANVDDVEGMAAATYRALGHDVAIVLAPGNLDGVVAVAGRTALGLIHVDAEPCHECGTAVRWSELLRRYDHVDGSGCWLHPAPSDDDRTPATTIADGFAR